MQARNADLLQAFQRCLDEGMQARDEEMLKFERATNRALTDLKNWVLRKRPSAESLGPLGPGRGDDGPAEQRHTMISPAGSALSGVRSPYGDSQHQHAEIEKIKNQLITRGGGRVSVGSAHSRYGSGAALPA